MAKALDENGFDGEERKLGEQTGLDRAFCGNSLSCKKPRKSTQVRHSLCEVSRIMHMFADKNYCMHPKFNDKKTPNYPSSPSRKRCELDVAYST